MSNGLYPDQNRRSVGTELGPNYFTAIKNHVIKYCTTVYERNGKKIFWSITNSGEILNKLKSRGFLASGLSIYDFSTLYTTLPHNLIKEKSNRIN